MVNSLVAQNPQGAFWGCIANDGNDNLVLNWEQATNPSNDFVAYEIFDINGVLINTINNINTTSMSIPGQGNVQNSYYIASVFQSGASILVSDTISNLLLDLNNPGNGEAVLNWNDAFVNFPSNFDEYYYIWRNINNTNWELVDSVYYSHTKIYRDTITVCEADIAYRVSLNNLGCEFVSNVDNDIFEDNIVPDMPVIQSVSVDSLTGNINIEWNVNGQSDTYGYVIYTEDANGFFVELDTVWGINNTSFEHVVNTDDGPLSYSVAAFDSCYTDIVPPTFQTSAKADINTSVFLSGIIDVCDRKVNLSWTDYIGFQMENYEIWGRKNNQAWTQMGSTSDNFWSTDIAFGDAFDFIVVANDQLSSNRASSNRINLFFESSMGPDYQFLAVASVENDAVEVFYKIGEDDGVDFLKFERFDNFSQSFKSLTTVNYNSGQNEYLFTDHNVQPNKNSYTYRVIVIDTCDQVLGISNIAKTVLLNVVPNEVEQINHLQWSNYEVFEGGVERYEIYRILDGVFDNDPIAVLPRTRQTYTDTLDLGTNNSFQGSVCYIIQAREGANLLGESETSNSNLACFTYAPIIYIPNAFTPQGQNPIFKPVTSLHDVQDYEFLVMDRLGTVVFKTNEIEEGWNGEVNNKFSNEMAQQGTYIYKLSLRNADGIEVLRHGHVTLLR